MRMMTICKQFHFDAAHWLPNVPDGHKCKRLHGHTYRVEIVVAGPLTAHEGWVCDYGDIADAWAPIEAELDHRCLNEIPGLENPTTELLALWLLVQLRGELLGIERIRVYESATTWCEAR